MVRTKIVYIIVIIFIIILFAKTKKYKNIDSHTKCIDIAKKDSAILSLYDPNTDLCNLLLKGYYDKDTVNWTIL